MRGAVGFFLFHKKTQRDYTAFVGGPMEHWKITKTEQSTVVIEAPQTLRSDPGLLGLRTLLRHHAKQHDITKVVINLCNNTDTDDQTVYALAVAAKLASINFQAELHIQEPNEQLQQLISSRNQDHLLSRCDTAVTPG
jgi:hypothetical protein